MFPWNFRNSESNANLQAAFQGLTFSMSSSSRAANYYSSIHAQSFSSRLSNVTEESIGGPLSRPATPLTEIAIAEERELVARLKSELSVSSHQVTAANPQNFVMRSNFHRGVGGAHNRSSVIPFHGTSLHPNAGTFGPVGENRQAFRPGRGFRNDVNQPRTAAEGSWSLATFQRRDRAKCQQPQSLLSIQLRPRRESTSSSGESTHVPRGDRQCNTNRLDCRYCKSICLPCESHSVEECPILARLNPCELCGAAGKHNHTIMSVQKTRYCPLRPKQELVFIPKEERPKGRMGGLVL